jgi:hypothetical protein
VEDAIHSRRRRYTSDLLKRKYDRWPCRVPRYAVALALSRAREPTESGGVSEIGLVLVVIHLSICARAPFSAVDAEISWRVGPPPELSPDFCRNLPWQVGPGDVPRFCGRTGKVRNVLSRICALGSLRSRRRSEAVQLGDELANGRPRRGVAVGMQTYEAYRDELESDRFQRLENIGARSGFCSPAPASRTKAHPTRSISLASRRRIRWTRCLKRRVRLRRSRSGACALGRSAHWEERPRPENSSFGRLRTVSIQAPDSDPGAPSDAESNFGRRQRCSVSGRGAASTTRRLPQERDPSVLLRTEAAD